MHHVLDIVLNGPAHYTLAHHLSNGVTVLFVIGSLLAELAAVWLMALLAKKLFLYMLPLIRQILRHCHIGKQDAAMVFLELIFPSDTFKSASATEQLHILLRHYTSSFNKWYRLAGYKQITSLEIYATKDDGIRYVIGVPAAAQSYSTQSLRSYVPGIKITIVDDYLAHVAGKHVGVVELGMSADFALPLMKLSALKDHDPIAYITGHMTKLAADDLIGYQVIVTPVTTRTHHRVIRHARSLQRQISAGKAVSSHLSTQRSTRGYYVWLISYPLLTVLTVMMNIVTALYEILVSALSKQHATPSFLNGSKDKRALQNPYQTEMNLSIKHKLDQPLYEVSIRLLASADDEATIATRLSALFGAFGSFTTTQQSILPLNQRSLINRQRRWYQRYRSRRLSPHFPDQQTVISSAELSDLYHFPYPELTKTEGLVKSRSRELPVPVSIRHSETKLDVVMGKNSHGGASTPIGMTLSQRQKHTYIIGKTGTGKTTLLSHAIYQDMVSGKGLAVLDPHGDMFQELLGLVPAHRLHDVVVFDPADRAFPVGLNILDPGIDFADDDEKNERITSAVLSVFAKLADENQWGPRMEHILRNATMTALQTPRPSLFTLQRLLTDKPFQIKVAATLKDPVLKQFWDKEFKLLGSMQLSSVTAPLTHRLGHFITTKMTRHILLQESTIRVADIMDQGKILLVNLSKGELGDDQSRFFGTILTSFIWMAAYQRTKIPEKQRKDFFLYVDEFQNFASPDFSDIVSEGRKYHVALIASHQSVAQITDQNLVKLIAGNASTLICFSVGPEDEHFMSPYMKPEVTEGDIMNLAPYHFYMKTTGEISEDAFSGQTLLMEVSSSDATKQAVIATSRKSYGTPKVVIEAAMEKLYKTQSNPSKTRRTAKNVAVSTKIEA
jgi:hypothetical protein